MRYDDDHEQCHCLSQATAKLFAYNNLAKKGRGIQITQ